MGYPRAAGPRRRQRWLRRGACVRAAAAGKERTPARPAAGAHAGPALGQTLSALAASPGCRGGPNTLGRSPGLRFSIRPSSFPEFSRRSGRLEWLSRGRTRRSQWRGRAGITPGFPFQSRARGITQSTRLRTRAYHDGDRPPAPVATVTHRASYNSRSTERPPLMTPAALVLLLCAFLPPNAPRPGQQTTTPPAAPPAYRNPHLPVRDRVADLLRRMTLEQKIAQLLPSFGQGGLLDPTGTFQPSEFAAAMRRMNDMAHPYDARTATILRNAVQRYQLEKTPLGIPVLFFGEALHGFMSPGATMFPMPIGLASTWDPALALRIYTAAGNEAAAEGVDQVFAPDLDLGREPRWGRTEETFGEDPYLVSRMGLAEVEGLQGTGYLIPRDHVLATAKHFAAHGQPEGGTNIGAVNISERILRANFFYPFQVAVERGHVGSVMASYNEIDGIPSSVNRWLLTQVLRREWGFDGYITSAGGGLGLRPLERRGIPHLAGAGAGRRDCRECDRRGRGPRSRRQVSPRAVRPSLRRPGSRRRDPGQRGPPRAGARSGAGEPGPAQERRPVAARPRP